MRTLVWTLLRIISFLCIDFVLQIFSYYSSIVHFSIRIYRLLCGYHHQEYRSNTTTLRVVSGNNPFGASYLTDITDRVYFASQAGLRACFRLHYKISCSEKFEHSNHLVRIFVSNRLHPEL